MAKGNGGESIVHDDVDRRAFVARLDQAVVQHRWACLACCLLDNHFHLLIRTPEPNLGVGMRWLKSAYAQDVNHRHKRTGHVFGGRFYSMRLKNDDHLLAALIYVLLNPVRAGVARLPHEWLWSSYSATVGIVVPPRFLHVAAALELFGDEPAEAQRRLAAAVAESLARDAAAALAGSDPWGQTPAVRPVGSGSALKLRRDP